MYSMNYQEENLEDGREERNGGGKERQEVDKNQIIICYYICTMYIYLLLESFLLVYLDNYSKELIVTALTITHLHI